MSTGGHTLWLVRFRLFRRSPASVCLAHGGDLGEIFRPAFGGAFRPSLPALRRGILSRLSARWTAAVKDRMPAVTALR